MKKTLFVLSILVVITTISIANAQNKYVDYCKIFRDSITKTSKYELRVQAPENITPSYLELSKINHSGSDGDFYRFIEIRYKNNTGYILYYDGMDKYSINDKFCFLYTQIEDTSIILDLIKELNNKMIFDSILYVENPNFAQTTATRGDNINVNIKSGNNFNFNKNFNYVSNASCSLLDDFDSYIEGHFQYRTFEKLDCEKATEILSKFHSEVAINYIIANKCNINLEDWFNSIIDTTLNSNYRNLLFSNLTNVYFGREEIISKLILLLINKQEVKNIMNDIDFDSITILYKLKIDPSNLYDNYSERLKEYIRRKRNGN